MARKEQAIEDIRIEMHGAKVWRDGRTFLVPFANILHIEYIKVEPA